MTRDAPRIGFVVGESSGDELAGAIAEQIRARRPSATFHGVGGERLRALGLSTFFDPDEIAIVGVTAVLLKLPRLLQLIRSTADRLATLELDALVLVDAPDFTHRVAARVRHRAPNLPIIKVVAPTVWAWRPERAAALRPIIDEILALFPFEPDVIERLHGPPTTFIGHPLNDDEELQRTAKAERAQVPTIAVLPGSRRSEIERLGVPFMQTLDVLRERVGDVKCIVPTLDHRRDLIERVLEPWKGQYELAVDRNARLDAFARSQAALAASGTVTLELALANIPTVVAYKLDALERQVAKRITTWAIAMPNIITDRLIMPEVVNELVRPERMARMLERLLIDTPERRAQLEGFNQVRDRLKQSETAASIAARRVLGWVDKSR